MAVLISTRTSVILTDVFVLLITWYKTYGIKKTVAEANIRISLSSLLLRDGLYSICAKDASPLTSY